jgi:endonuclease/exonuclease/phosphatase family metal-dependent hydrolase
VNLRLLWVIVPLALAAAYVAAVVIVNRMVLPNPKLSRFVQAREKLAAPETITLCTWNMGYAGLGEESDFLSDGGRHVLPPSRVTVEKNLAGIKSVLREVQADIFLFQEVAQPGLLTYGVDMQHGVEAEFPGFARSFLPDAETRLLPRRYSVHHGTEVFSRYPVEKLGADLLPGESRSLLGILRKTYGIQRFEIAGGMRRWSIMTVHLAAFDDDAAMRKQQLKQVIETAEREYKSGAHVIVGGDWNLRLTATRFPDRTDPKFLFWVHDFPQEALPQGWHLAFDPKTPSVRTNYQPYQAGVNYVTIIDGFLVSPNVKIVSVAGRDTGFRFSDHQPVVLQAAMADDP